MKKTMKFLSLVLSLCLITSICPFGAFAENLPKIESVQIDDITIDAGSGSFSSLNSETGQTELGSYYSYWFNLPSFAVEFSNGDVEYTKSMYILSSSGGEDTNYHLFNYGEHSYVLNILGENAQSYDNPWKPGNTYAVNYEIYAGASGIEDYKGSFNVTIKESNVQSIQLNDINLYEGLDSQITSTGYSYSQQKYIEYTYYSAISSKITGNVTFADGATKSLSRGGVYDSNNKYYYLNINHLQSPDNVWEVGETYRVIAVVDGITTTVNVHICENPVESVEFDDVEVIESATKYNYYPNATITFKDGSVKTQKSNSGIDFGNNRYSFSFFDNQNETSWSVGNTYTATGTIMGISAQFNVTVLPTPISSIQINNIELYEQIDGYELKFNQKEYFKYYYTPSGTVTFSDGTTKDFSGGFRYNDEWLSINVTDNQFEEHWEVGNTYTVTGTILGVSSEFNVTIKEIPFKSIEIEDLFKSCFELNNNSLLQKLTCIVRDENGKNVFENTHGYSWGGNNYKIYFQTIGEYKDKTWSMQLTGAPEYGNWTPGEYQLTAKFGKLSTTFTVTASENKSENGYSYLESKDGVIITGIDSNNSYISIPTTLSGKNVIGINSLGNVQESVKNLVIPDGVKFISSNIFDLLTSSNLPLEILYLGKDVKSFNAEMLVNCPNLKNVYVSADNQNYSDDGGVLYNKSKSKLIWYPLGRDKKIELSSSIEDFSCLDFECYSHHSVSFVGVGGNFITEDGVTYNADKTYIICCDEKKNGSYDMPDTVLNIRSGAFKNCKNLSNVSISDSVTEIMYATFAGCDSLNNIDLPKNLKSLDDYAICDCNSLESISIPDGVVKIGERALANNINLKSFNFPSNLNFVGYGAFSNTGITELVLPDNSNISGWEFAFSDCNKLEKVEMIEGSTSIAKGMFRSCKRLESFSMPDSIIKIRDESFACCNSLSNIILSNNLNYIGCMAFEETGLTSIDFPYSLEKIDRGAFCNSVNLSEITFEREDTVVREDAFYCCPLKNIPFPTVTEVVYSRSYYGSAAKSISIPDTVISIGTGAFENSVDLLDIEMPSHLESLGRTTFDNTAWYNTKPDGFITIDDYILYCYKGDYCGNPIVNIKKNVSVLAGGVFENGLHGDTSKIERIIIPEGVKQIPENAFDGCTNLKSITIPSSVKKILDKSAFSDCSSLTDIYYLGTEQQWNEIDRIYILSNVNIHFVNEIVPFEISIESRPTKNIYEIGDNFDTSGLSIKVLYSNGSEEILTDGFVVSGFDSSKLGTNNLTISYSELTCTCPITIDQSDVSVVAEIYNSTTKVAVATTLEDALEAAAAGQTVKLVANITNEKFVIVENGVILDLNGNNITGAKMIYVTGQLKDSNLSARGYINASAYMFGSEQEYAPVYDSTRDGYALVKLRFAGNSGMTGNAMKFTLANTGARTYAYSLLKNNEKYCDTFKAYATVTWTAMNDAVKGETIEVSQDFLFNSKFMNRVVDSVSDNGVEQFFEVTVTGINEKATLQAKYVFYDKNGNQLFVVKGDTYQTVDSGVSWSKVNYN